MKTQLTVLNSMFGSDFTMALDRFVALGLDLVDLKDGIFNKSIANLTESEMENAAQALELRGLQAFCLSSELFYDDIEKGEEYFRKHHFGKLPDLIRIANRLRPSLVRLLAARSAVRASFTDSGGYIARNAPWLIPMYREAVDQLHNAGFQVTIENECSDCIWARPEEILAFFAELNRNGKVHFTYDVQNLWEMGTYPSIKVYHQLKPVIGFLHLKGGQAGKVGNALEWSSALEDASWPVAEIVTQAVRDSVSPVICLNPSHGKIKSGYSYDQIVERDLQFVKSIATSAV